MTIDTLPLRVLVPSKDNPRSEIDEIEGLAATILKFGVLQNLIVAPLGGRGSKGRHGIIGGHRRHEALCLLESRGQVDGDYEVPVTIRTNLSEAEKRLIATVENTQRKPLPPMDEAHAFARLLKDGTSLEEVVAQTGLSTTTIKRRLVLNDLCTEAQTALRDGTLNLALAEALTLGSHDYQRHLVERITEEGDQHYSAEMIKRRLLSDSIPVSVAIFDCEQYTGSYTSDLFADDDSTYFNDVEQFWLLQHEAVTQLAEQYRQQAAWVDITEDYTLRKWQYDKAEDGDEGGVVINLSQKGVVEVAEGLVKRLSSAELAALGDGNPLAPKPKPAYSAVLCEIIAHEKSLAVQAALLSNPRKAKEVAVVLMLAVNDSYDRPLDLTPHRCLHTGAEADEPSKGYTALEEHAQPLAAQILPEAAGEDEPVWQRLLNERREAGSLYGAVKALSDADLDTLHLLLPVLCMGQGHCNRLDTADSFFNQVAGDLQIDMRQWWRPDEAFLKRRTKAQLLEIVKASGVVNTHNWLNNATKAEVVTALCQHFEGETEAARNWLPGAMQFPAVEQDGSAETAEADSGMDTAA